MPHKYSTALSHIVLAGTGIYCLSRVHAGGFLHCPTISYGIIVANSLIGVWRWGNPDHGDKADKVYKFTSLLETIFALPCINTQLWLDFGYMPVLAWAHSAVSLIPLLAYISNSSTDNDLIDLIVGINVISMGALSIAHENYFGIATAISFCLAYFFVRNENSIKDIPAKDLYNYGLCFFAYLGLRALTDSGLLR